jgi:hypothetical protein
MNMLQLKLRNLSHRNRFCSELNVSLARRARPGLTCRPIVVCVGFLLLGNASFAAIDVSEVPHAVSAVQADEDLRALLLEVEQQISTRRAFSPPDDNALSTWPRVIQKSFPTSPGALRALADFVSRVRNRAADEQAAGRTDVSMDFTLFKDLANTILVSAVATPASSSNAQTATSQPMARDPAGPASEPADMANSIDTQRRNLPDPIRANSVLGPAASVASPAMGADTNAEHPAPAAGQVALTIAGAVPRLSPRAQASQEQSRMTAMYASRGDEMLAIKDISAARKFYEHAANGGRARAATTLAKTYDPAFLTQLGAVGVRPDPVLAEAWYRRAVALGDLDAEDGLRALSMQFAK